MKKIDLILDKINCGKRVVLSSDAGMPLISDPGRHLVNTAIEKGIKIVPIPGVSAVITALSVSGFNIDNFRYLGFFPRKKI